MQGLGVGDGPVFLAQLAQDVAGFVVEVALQHDAVVDHGDDTVEQFEAKTLVTQCQGHDDRS